MNKIITHSLILLLSLADIALAHSVMASESSATGHLESGNPEADLPQLWFDDGADGQEEIERLKALAQGRVSENERRFAARTGRNSIPLSALEYADDSVDDVHLLAQIDLLQASTDKNQYNQWHQNGVERLEKLANLAHTRWLKQMIAEYGFPVPSAFGMDAYTAAWTIAQHASHLPDFQRDILSRMKVLYSKSEGDGRYIALLEGRLALVAGKPQSFGIQMTCQDGQIRLYDTNDPDDLDERRAVMGLKPLSESSLLGRAC